MTTLPLEYYQHHDVLYLSQDLLGKYLITNIDGTITGGVIIETEAYQGPEDRASHAFGNRRTKRTEVMYSLGGTAYVYLCYGIHSLFNVVTNDTGIPHAILIRAIKPEMGLETMLKRRNKQAIDKSLCNGPGALTEALGINLSHNGILLTGPEIWIEDRGLKVDAADIVRGPRVGVDYAGPHAEFPWRFRLPPTFFPFQDRI